MQSLGNCMLVFQNDPLLKGAIRRNSLTERIDIEKNLGWCRSDTAVTDTDINYLRLYFEENYSITAEKNIQCALDIVANEAHYHPICDVLLGLQWDGEERICNALTKFLGVEKTPYTTEALPPFLCKPIVQKIHPIRECAKKACVETWICNPIFVLDALRYGKSPDGSLLCCSIGI